MLRTLSIAAFLVMVLAGFGLLAAGALFSPSPAVIAVQAAALALLLWARLALSWRRSFHAGADPTPGGLVTTGPYRYIRHPIYTSFCLFTWPGVLAHWSVLSVVLGLILLAGALARMACEERLIAERYPEYRQYARTTKRMVPYLF